MWLRLAVVFVVVVVAGAQAQDLISARAGFVNYRHGQVNLPKDPDGKPIRQLQQGQSVSTRFGRAELLLVPGSFLRLDNESEARLISSSLEDARVELLSGTATLEVNEIPKGASLTLLWRGFLIPVTKPGLYRFEPGPDSMRIYVEEGKLKLPGSKETIKAGKYVDLTAAGTLSAAMKFNRKNQDEFDRWSASRSLQLARASFVAASSLRRWPFSLRSSLWYWDPFGFYTFLPYSSTIYSPFGFPYYCPRTIYISHPRSHSPGGMRGGGVGSGRNVGGSAPGPGATAAPAPPTVSSPRGMNADRPPPGGIKSRIPD